jgi:hypothetical protein
MDRFDPYRKQITLALDELVHWGEKKKQAEHEMAKLRQLIVANANMLPEDERGAFIKSAEDSITRGFTDGIRQAFRDVHPDPLSPTGVRDKLVAMGYDLSSQSNAMASIHSVIRRLLDAGEIERYGAGDLGVYRWKQTGETEDTLRANRQNHPLREALIPKRKTLAQRVAENARFVEGHAARIAQDHDKKK